MHPSDSTPTKPCSKCGTEYPLTPEYFYRDKHAPTGLRSDCRACNKAKVLQYRNDHLEASRARELRYNETHREQRAAYIRQLRIEQPEYENAHRDKEGRRRQQRKWFVDNPDKKSAYKRKDSAKRRAYKAKSAGAYKPQDIHVQYRSQRGKCWHCGVPVGDDYHVDHLIPLSRGGSNSPENIVISCPSCNLSKGAKLPQEWNGRLL